MTSLWLRADPESVSPTVSDAHPEISDHHADSGSGVITVRRASLPYSWGTHTHISIYKEPTKLLTHWLNGQWITFLMDWIIRQSKYWITELQLC